MADMTVLEFAAKRADECSCGTDRLLHIAADIDSLIEGAVVQGKVLWETVADEHGHPSILWRSYPEEAFAALMALEQRFQTIKQILGGIQ